MILLLKTGTAPSTIRSIKGDFENWISDKMGLDKSDYFVHEVGNYQLLPPEQPFSCIIITGSPLMVTELKLAGTPLCNWILEKQNNGTPILGICFGHQLLSVINDCTIDYNPAGSIIGSTITHLTEAGQADELLGQFPAAFEVYKSHQQIVTEAPDNASVLAINKTGVIDAIRFQDKTWGIQFHPEFDASITKLYIREQSDGLRAEGKDVEGLLNQVVEVDFGERLFSRFKEIALDPTQPVK